MGCSINIETSTKQLRQLSNYLIKIERGKMQKSGNHLMPRYLPTSHTTGRQVQFLTLHRNYSPALWHRRQSKARPKAP